MNFNVKRITFLIFIVLIGLLLYQWMEGTGQAEQISYSTFQQQLEDGNIQDVKFKGKTVTGNYRSPNDAPGNKTKFNLVIPPGSEDKLYTQLTQKNVEIRAESQEQSWWSMLLVNSIPVLLIIGIWLYFIWRTRQSMGQGGMMGVGQSQAELYDEETPDVTFDDVAGYKGPKNEVQQVIEFLGNPDKFDSVGGEIPKGVLLVGPPGTGKTLTARAIAGEAGVPFLMTSGSDFMEMFVGVGASRVRDLFERAKELSPAIIFIDEIDSVGRKRGAGVGGGHDEREQTLNQLLDELDGFEPNSGVILIAATNRPDVLDPALMRPGRFDREVTFDMPTVDEREAILEKHAENKPLTGDIDLNDIAKGTPGFSGADLKNLLNEAALLTAENDNEQIDQETLDEARDKVMMGLRREDMAISEKEKETMAIHESGHTVVAFFTEGADPVHKVTIIPRGKALGATQQLPVEEKKMYSRKDIMGRLSVMMGGRAAESMKNQSVTNGAQDDLRRATKLARKMVLQWGMSSDLGNIAYEDNGGNVFLGEEMSKSREYSEDTAEKIDEEIKKILDEATRNAERTLKDNKDELDDLINVLIKRESLTSDQITSLLEDGEILPENGTGNEDTEKEEATDEEDSEEEMSSDEEFDGETDEESETVDEDKTSTEDSTDTESDSDDSDVDASNTVQDIAPEEDNTNPPKDTNTE